MRTLLASLSCIFILLGAVIPLPALAHSLDDDETVMFLPDTAAEQADGSVKIRVSAWIYEQAIVPGLESLLAHHLDISLDDLPPDLNYTIFKERAQYFKTDSESREHIGITLAGETFDLPKTNEAGRTDGAFVIAPASVSPSSGGNLEFGLHAPKHALDGQTGRAFFVPASGVSVVSDIDDTIKDSNIQDRSKFLKATFFKPFSAVPGMAAWYRTLAETLPNASFHYLSGSPIQLYPSLAAFIKDEDFPPGSIHLRETTSLSAMTSLVLDENNTGISDHKTRMLERLMNDSPNRQFILIGDSGERDPEIYADIARTRPEQVIAIFIRNVTGQDRNAARYKTVFAELPDSLWQILDD